MEAEVMAARGRFYDPTWVEYNKLTQRRATDRPLRRKGRRPPPPTVGDASALLGKECDPEADGIRLELPDDAGWQAEQIGLGVSRCPTDWGDHQWPTHTAVITLRIAQAVSVRVPSWPRTK